MDDNKNPSNTLFRLGFESATKVLENEETSRMALVERKLPFGIKFLDQACSGILPDDMVLIGARTGAGKTEISTLIALTNALNNKRVKFFALEASRGEIERRIKFNILSYLYHDDNMREPGNISYRLWYEGKCPFLKRYEPDFEDYKANLSPLMTYYREGSFNINNFSTLVLALNQEIDLIVVDHIQYFDTEGRNENQEYSDIVKKIRDVSQLDRIPVVLVSHLRKSGGGSMPILAPDESEFMGTSNIPKVATKVVTLAPGKSLGDGRFETYFRVCKNRIEGSTNRYVGVCTFDTKTNSYEKSYQLATIEYTERGMQTLVGIQDINELPYWARD